MKLSERKSIVVKTRNNSEIYCYSVKRDDGEIEHPNLLITNDFVDVTSVDGNRWVIPMSSVDYFKVVHEDNITFDEED